MKRLPEYLFPLNRVLHLPLRWYNKFHIDGHCVYLEECFVDPMSRGSDGASHPASGGDILSIVVRRKYKRKFIARDKMLAEKRLIFTRQHLPVAAIILKPVGLQKLRIFLCIIRTLITTLLVVNI